jgi:maltose O-acetyltransferase
VRLLQELLARLIGWSRHHPLENAVRIDGSTFFPAFNRHLLRRAPGAFVAEAYFNLWDEVVIEEGAIVAHEVMFLTGRHAHDGRRALPEAISAGPIRVGAGAWVASRAILLGGVTIGPGSIVGAGAVVTTDVPPQEFWAGNPARFVRSLSQ